MAASEEFKRHFQAGEFLEALRLAVAESAELKVTTWVAPADADQSQPPDQPQPGYRLFTRMNIVEGDINNEVGAAFLDDGLYSELREFHADQVETGHQTIHWNLQGLHELFKTLTHGTAGDGITAEIGYIEPPSGVSTGNVSDLPESLQPQSQIESTLPGLNAQNPMAVVGPNPQLFKQIYIDPTQPATLGQSQQPLPSPGYAPKPGSDNNLTIDLSPDVMFPPTLNQGLGSSGIAASTPNSGWESAPVYPYGDNKGTQGPSPSGINSSEITGIDHGTALNLPDLSLTDGWATQPNSDASHQIEPTPYIPQKNAVLDPSISGQGEPGSSSSASFSWNTLKLLLTGIAFKLVRGQTPTSQDMTALKTTAMGALSSVIQGRTAGESAAAGIAIAALGAVLLWGANRAGLPIPMIGGNTPEEISDPTPVSSYTTKLIPDNSLIPSVEFTDVATQHWAYPFIMAMAERGFVEGNPQGEFLPNKQITRAEFAALISKPLNSPVRRQSITYKDVKSDYWAVQVIDEATRTDFMEGYPKQEFRPETSISRVELLVTIVSGLDLKPTVPPAETLKRFKDANQIPKWAIPSIAAATEAGIVINQPDVTLLAPRRPATRAEATAVMHQALLKLGKVPPVTSPYIVPPTP